MKPDPPVTNAVRPSRSPGRLLAGGAAPRIARRRHADVDHEGGQPSCGAGQEAHGRPAQHPFASILHRPRRLPERGSPSMSVQTTVTELPDSRVRLDAEVPSEEIESRLQRAATALGRELKLPGFRQGKVPPAMVIQRMGREAVLEQAVRDSLPEWYEEAIMRSGVSTVGDPKLDLTELPAAGEPLSFSIEVGTTPRAKLGRYRDLEVGRREPDVPEEAVQAGARPVAGVLRAARQRRTPGRAGGPSRGRLRGQGRRRGVQGRPGPRLHARARRRAADRGLRGAARGRERRRRSRGRGAVPGRVPGRGAPGPEGRRSTST